MGACSCGHDLSAADRYCPQCGTPASTQTTDGPSFLNPDGSRDADGALLLAGVADAESAESASVVRSGRRGPWLVGGGIAVLALLWALFAWPKTDTPIEGIGQEQEEDAADTTSTTRPPRTTTTSEAEDAIDIVENAEETEPSIRMVEGAESGPLLGEPTGLAVVLGRYGHSAAIELIDLDSGKIHELEERGIPVASIGSHLVVETDNGVLLVIDLASPSDDPVRIGDSLDEWTSFVAVEDDVIWVTSASGPEQPSLVAYSVDGEESTTLDLALVPIIWGWTGDTDLINNSAGGVYERSGDSFRRVSPGLLRAAGDSIALIHECDEQMNCRSAWFDRSSWEALPYPVPEYDPGFAQAVVLGEDRWLVEGSWNSERTTISDIETGETVRESVGFSRGPINLPAISADGRWLFEAELSKTTIVDLFNEREFELELSTKLDLAAVFVPLAGTAFDG